jgi:hypothetical protein
MGADMTEQVLGMGELAGTDNIIVDGQGRGDLDSGAWISTFTESGHEGC